MTDHWSVLRDCHHRAGIDRTLSPKSPVLMVLGESIDPFGLPDRSTEYLRKRNGSSCATATNFNLTSFLSSRTSRCYPFIDSLPLSAK